ncbi:MAG TPA: hypothetical protein VGB30_01300 [bacterium]|jgi:hypothetical protein
MAEAEGNEKLKFYPEGNAVWIQWENRIAEGDFDLEHHMRERIRKYPERSLHFAEFTRLSETRKRYWEDILQICDENNIQLYVYFPPAHPDLMDSLYDLGAEPLFDEISNY